MPEDAAVSPEEDELNRLDAGPSKVVLKSGVECLVHRLRTRQFFRLLKVLTHGAGPAIRGMELDFKQDPSVFATQLLMMVVFSIPDAEQETLDFINAMCEPVGLVPGLPRDLTAKERDHNQELWVELTREIVNPVPEDTMTILEAIVANEAPEIQSLGKRFMALLETARRLGQLKAGKADETPSPQELSLPDSSPASSTSSPASTDGATSESSTSRSAGSARSRRPSRAASTTPS